MRNFIFLLLLGLWVGIGPVAGQQPRRKATPLFAPKPVLKPKPKPAVAPKPKPKPAVAPKPKPKPKSAFAPVPKPVEESWKEVFFNKPERALALLTAAAIRNSPAVRSMELEKAIYGEDLQLARLNILNGVSLGSTYSYGNLTSIQLIDPASPNQFNTFSSGRYSVGASVAVPLDRVFGRRHLIGKERLQMERAESVRREREAAVRQQVLQLYQQVLLAKKVLAVYEESLVTAQMNQLLAEKSFRRGQDPMAELTAANNQFAQANIARETAASQYTVYFLTLEAVAGGRISILMTNN